MTTPRASGDARRVWPWVAGALALALPIAVPIAAVVLAIFAPTTEVWAHLRDSVLLEYVGNTVALLIAVAVIVLLIGVTCAWLVATKDFPGRRWLMWALILPFAAPAYVVAYAYADLLSYAGPLQSALRALDLSFSVPIRSLPGAAFVLGLTLYPYVYLFAYNAFADQAKPLMEAARSLGAGRRRAFFAVALPHARPALAGGVALAMMETAADFGVVDFFGVPTLTSGVFRTWFAQGEHQAAMQLAGWLFVVAAVLVVLEQLARRGLGANPVARNRAASPERLDGWAGWLAFGLCALPLLLGFVLPGGMLAWHALTVGDPRMGSAFAGYLGNTVWVAAIAAALAALIALWLSYATRLHAGAKTSGGWLLRVGVRTATLGYALPGMVLAVGLIVPLTALDRSLAGWLNATFDLRVGLLLTGSTAALIFVYLARFVTVAFNGTESGMVRIHPHYDAAARSLGSSPLGVLRRVHLPIMTPVVLTAFLMVFVDVVKELPATLVLRPFNFETLATRAYRLASDERIAEASTAALLIVVVGLLPALLLAKQNFGRTERS